MVDVSDPVLYCWCSKWVSACIAKGYMGEEARDSFLDRAYRNLRDLIEGLASEEHDQMSAVQQQKLDGLIWGWTLALAEGYVIARDTRAEKDFVLHERLGRKQVVRMFIVRQIWRASIRAFTWWAFWHLNRPIETAWNKYLRSGCLSRFSGRRMCLLRVIIVGIWSTR